MDFQLAQSDLVYIFNNILRQEDLPRIAPQYDRFIKASRQMLSFLTGEQLELLIELLNSDFKYSVNYTRQTTMIDDFDMGDEFIGYGIACQNTNTMDVIIDAYNHTKQSKGKFSPATLINE